MHDTEANDFALAMAAFGVVMTPRDDMEFIDQIEQRMVECFAPVEVELNHTFSRGLYSRTANLPAGGMFTSKIHNTQHQLLVTVGSISVWTKATGAFTVHAPYHCITEPGTRRIVFAHTDAQLVTFHPTDETDLSVIEDQIIMKHTNPLLEGGQP